MPRVQQGIEDDSLSSLSISAQHSSESTLENKQSKTSLFRGETREGSGTSLRESIWDDESSSDGGGEREGKLVGLKKESMKMPKDQKNDKHQSKTEVRHAKTVKGGSKTRSEGDGGKRKKGRREGGGGGAEGEGGSPSKLESEKRVKKGDDKLKTTKNQTEISREILKKSVAGQKDVKKSPVSPEKKPANTQEFIFIYLFVSLSS